MASADTSCRKSLNAKNCAVESHDFHRGQDGVLHLHIKARPTAWRQNGCPLCGKTCPGYGKPAKRPKVWRGLDFGGILAKIECRTYRVRRAEHGVVTAAVPWAYPGGSFTKGFDRTVARLAKHLPRSAVAAYMRIDRQTVGNCISRTLHDLEPDRSRRLDGLVHIGIDETGYRKGHKHTTVVASHDANEAAWAANGRGFKVLGRSCKGLSPEQPASIKAAAGDGARWIADCADRFAPGCERCADPSHVVE